MKTDYRLSPLNFLSASFLRNVNNILIQQTINLKYGGTFTQTLENSVTSMYMTERDICALISSSVYDAAPAAIKSRTGISNELNRKDFVLCKIKDKKDPTATLH